MNTISRVKMEYPFPANDVAQQAQLWKDAKEFSEVNFCVDSQRGAAIAALDALRDNLNENKLADVQIALESWKTIFDLCNLIRCVATRSDFNGELIGLNVLFRILAEE